MIRHHINNNKPNSEQHFPTDEEEDKKNAKENNDGIYNYDAPEPKPEQDHYTIAGGYSESPRTRRRRIQNPQHIKLMVVLIPNIIKCC